MRIFGRMAGIQVTAHQKFEEAAHFYDRMMDVRTNVQTFPYYLSAFLSAFRSVTFYLQKQFGNDSRFKDWYQAKQNEMRDDSTLKMLSEKRTTAIHLEPFDQLFFQKGIKSFGKSNERSVFTNFLQIHDGIGDDGELQMSIRVGQEGEKTPVQIWVSWHFTADDELDVMDHCHTGLEKMKALLEEFAGLGIEPPPRIDDEDLSGSS